MLVQWGMLQSKLTNKQDKKANKVARGECSKDVANPVKQEFCQGEVWIFSYHPHLCIYV